MAKMINAQHAEKCPYGCCGNLPDQRNLGTHANETKTNIKRSLKKRDRQTGKNETKEME